MIHTDVHIRLPDGDTLLCGEMVTGAAELILGSERGSCAMAVDPAQEIPLKLQAVYVLETIAPPALNADRFLPPTPVSIIVDPAGHAIDGTEAQNLKDADPWKLLEHESIRTQMIPAMIEATRPLAEQAAEFARIGLTQVSVNLFDKIRHSGFFVH